MKIKEIIVEAKIDFELEGQHIYKNPSPTTEVLLRKFRLGAARFLVDERDGSVWMWDALFILHGDVANYLNRYDKRDVEGDGFSFILKGNKYRVWSDSSVGQTHLQYLLTMPMVKRMFKKHPVVWDENAGKSFWGNK